MIVALLITTGITNADVLANKAEAEAGRVIWPLWTQCGEFHITKVVKPPLHPRFRGSRSTRTGESSIT
jgi:hypothetical protein